LTNNIYAVHDVDVIAYFFGYLFGWAK